MTSHRTLEPKSRSQVPRWLEAHARVRFVDGRPVLEDWDHALSYARACLDTELLWEDAKLRGRPRRRRRRSQAFPRADTVALAEFTITLSVRNPKLHVSTIAWLAWWQGLLVRKPDIPDVVNEVRKLMRRHWICREHAG